MITKTEENIVRGNSCYTLFQTLWTDRHHSATTDFLKEIINSHHHFWQGDKFPEGMTWTFSDDKGWKQIYRNVKTFGFYNNENVRPEDYKKIDFGQFVHALTSIIFEETDDKEYEDKIKNLIQPFQMQSLNIFQFIPEQQLERSKFSVYSYFIGFVLVDKELKKAIRIEFGQD